MKITLATAKPKNGQQERYYLKVESEPGNITWHPVTIVVINSIKNLHAHKTRVYENNDELITEYL